MCLEREKTVTGDRERLTQTSVRAALHTETVAPVIKDSADKSLLYIKLKKHLIKKHSHPCSHSVLCLTFEDTAVVENAYGKHIKFRKYSVS